MRGPQHVRVALRTTKFECMDDNSRWQYSQLQKTVRFHFDEEESSQYGPFMRMEFGDFSVTVKKSSVLLCQNDNIRMMLVLSLKEDCKAVS